MARIVIDPGHGMGNRSEGVYDPGAVAWLGNRRFEEATIVMDYALTLKAVLAVSGFHPVLTRQRVTRLVNGQLETQHTPASLSYRRELADGALALVSLHLNSHRDSSVRGFEVFYRFDYQKALAQRVYDELAGLFRDFMPLRGVKVAPFAVLKTACPAVLIELGFVSNPQDALFLCPADALAYRQRRLQVANAIDRAMRDYFNRARPK